MSWSWTFRGYLRQGENIVQAWYDHQTAAVRAEFDLLMQTLRSRSQHDWADIGASKPLKGAGKGLIELRFTVEKVRYRPIGFFGVGQQVFTILTIATKHDFDQQRARAATRKPLVQANPGANSDECDCLRSITRKAW